MLRDDLKYITIDQLRVTNQISVRTANCCFNAEFDSLYDIVSYYEQGYSFRTIRNAGKLTCEELENLCRNTVPQINDFTTYSLENTEEKGERKNIESIEVVIQNKYLELLESFSIRTQNILSKYSADEFIKYYLRCNINELYKIKNAGRKSVDEMIIFRNKFLSFIEEIKGIDDSQTQNIRFGNLSKYGKYVEFEFIMSFFEKKGHLPMFWILEQFVKNDNTTKIEVLIDSFPIFQNQQLLSLKEIAQKHKLSRERIRQIHSQLFHKILRIPIVFIHYCNDELLHNKFDWAYLFYTFNGIDIACQESIEVQNCLKDEKCNFTVEFALQIIAYVFRDIFSLLGGIDSSNKTKTWANTFLIRREYSDIFDFEKMRSEFIDILIDNDSEYLLDIEEYVANSHCWIKYDYNKNDNIISIVRDILLYEFHLYSDDIDGVIKIPANKERKPIDVIYEILQKTGNPMHINEIFEEFKIILPDHKYTEASQLRPYLQRHDAISYRNRNSVYMLKEWDHIKTGTIRDAIVEFLIGNDLPQTVDNITEYVLQYFPDTNVSSVRTSMLIDTPKRFSYFNNNHFGLNNKEYPPEYELCEPQDVMRRTFEQRLLDLELFIVEEEHFPFTSSDNCKESSLGRWWYRIINNKQNISEYQQTEIERVKSQYSGYDTDKTTYDWHLNYNKLKCFILENRRLPSALGDEKFLYGWFRRAKTDFQKNSFTEEQRQKFINLAKLI